jgi:WD40 repeat protein/serine/threonine protein kinase
MSTDSSRDRDPLDRMAEEFVARHRRGERPALTEYVELHPELAEEIRDLFPALVMMEQLKPADADPTGAFAGGGGVPACPAIDRLGEFRILREVGRGGMGVVYEAVQESLGRHVALKVLPMNGRIDPVQMERFRLEARSAARLHHTHIVPVHGVGEHEGVHYYAMQFIPGCGLDAVINDLRRLRPGAPDVRPPSEPELAGRATLADASRSRAVAELLLTGQDPGPRPADRPPVEAGDGRPATRTADSSALSGRSEPGYFRSVARIGMQVAEALAHAHQQGVLHRDIKPSNLLLDADGQVWVTDFGLAKVEGGDGLTRTGDIVGTLRYMAPERFDGWSDPRSDVYGLGMTLYELLTLRPAHEAGTRARLIEKVLHEPPTPPRRVDATVPRDLETVVLKAIAKDPAERYPTAKALAEDLQNFLASKPIMARRISPVERAWRWCRRNPSAAGLVGVSALAVLTLVGLGVALQFQSRIQKAYDEAARQRGIAEIALGNERAFLYTNRVIFAQRELKDHNPYRAGELLEECPKDRRGWEWHYLERQCRTELLSMTGHDEQVLSVAFTPDGRRIVSGGGRSVRVWDAASGSLIHNWDDYKGLVSAVAVSLDGRRLTTCSGTPSAPEPTQVRDMETGRILLTLDARTGSFGGMAYSADGRLVAVAGGDVAEDRASIRICNATTGAIVKTIQVEDRPVMSPSFSPDGRSLIAAVGPNNTFESSNRTNRVVIWDTETGRERFRLKADRASVITATFSPDGKTIAAAGYDAVIHLWDAETGRPRQELVGHENCVNQVVFSRDGGRIASSSDDNTVIIWDAASGKPLFSLCGHRSGIFGLVFSPDGKQLATGGYDGRVKLWDVAGLRESLSLPTPPESGMISGLAFSRQSDLLASGYGDHSVRIWEMPRGRLKATLTGHHEAVWSVAFSPDGRWLASAAGDWRRPNEAGEVYLWDVRTGQLLRELKAHRGIVWTVDFSPDSSRLASGGGETHDTGDQVIIWDAASGRQLHTFPCPKGGSRSVTFSPDGGRIAAATGHLIRTWDVETGQTLVTFAGHKDTVARICYTSDGNRLVSGGTDKTIRVWNAATGDEIWRSHAHTFTLEGLDMSPDNRRIASAGGDKKLKIWNAESGQELLSLRGHDSYILGVAFSPDGRWIATSDQLGTIKLWDGSPIPDASR